MRFKNFSPVRARVLPGLLWLALAPLLPAQTNSILTAVTPRSTTAQRDGTLTAKITVQLRNGYHVNSNKPNDDYLIPLRLTWDPSPQQMLEIVYPQPRQENYVFSKKPVSVFTGDFDILTRFHVPASAPLGLGVLTGKLRYQACSQSECFPPKTVPVSLPIHIQAK